MHTAKDEQRLWLSAVPVCQRTKGSAGLGIAAVATLLVLSAACGGTAKPTSTTPAPLAASATVALAAPIAATPATPAAADTGKKAAKRDALARVQLTAGMVTQSFQRHQLPASQVQAVTSQNDPDGQLGKPNQYTSRADFIDTTLATSGDWSLANGGAVEVFDSVAGAARAKHQLQAGHGGSAPSELDYQAGTILLRLSPRLSQPQIADYEKATKDALKAAVKVAEGRQSGKKPAAATPTPTP